jgi:hypothetical protein
MPDVPPPGRDLPFETWTRRLVAQLRTMIPEVAATQRGREVTLAYRERAATIIDRHPTWVVHFSANMAGLAIDRHDDFTAHTVAKTLAGYFDDRWAKG